MNPGSQSGSLLWTTPVRAMTAVGGKIVFAQIHGRDDCLDDLVADSSFDGVPG